MWRLLDLGIVEAAGVMAYPRCTPGYAAPEVITALSYDRDIEVHPSQDVWALGALVFEAVTSEVPFPKTAGAAAPYQCAAGERAYPWEGDGAPIKWRRSRLRPLASQCLAREASARPSAADVVAAIARMGCTTTTEPGA